MGNEVTAPRTTEIRPVEPSDRAALAEFYQRLSTESRYSRFLGFTRGLTADQSRSMCSLNHVSDEGFVATAQRHGRDIIVGHLCLDRVEPGVVELGVAVSDDVHGSGIGRRLFEAAMAWAWANGSPTIVATAFADNSRVLRLLTSAPYPARVTAVPGGVVEVEIATAEQPVCDHPPSWPPRATRPARLT